MGNVMSYNILLVEDETGIAEGIMDYMKEGEITFTWAADGDEALALVYEHEYDLALLDVMLPGQMDLRYAEPSGQRATFRSFF